MKYSKSKDERSSEAREHIAKFKSKTRMKRLTIDVPIELHTAIKVDCARRGAKMADVIRDLLERKFGKVS